MKYLILILISLGIYANALQGDFILDDIPLVQNVEDLQTTPWFHPTSLTAKYIINTFGVEKLPLHLPSLILHVLNVLLVFVLLRAFFRGKEIPAFLGALIFAVHPIHCEAVSWIAGRPYLFTTFAWLSVLYLYGMDGGDKGWRYFLALHIFAYFAILSYPWLLSLVIMMMVLPLFLKKGNNFYKWGWIPFAIILLFAIWRNHPTITARVMQSTSRVFEWKRQLLLICYSIESNFSLCVAPIKLMFYHEFKHGIVERLWKSFAYLIAYFSLLTIFVNTYWKEHGKVLLFWAIAFVAILLPTYSPVAICWIVAERYLYLPSILFSVVVAFTYCITIKKYPKTFWIVFSIVFLLFCGKTLHRNYEWGNRLRFWKAGVKVEKGSAIARNNLATCYLQMGAYEAAKQEFKISAALEPYKTRAWYNLGLIAHLEIREKIKADKRITQEVIDKANEAFYYYKVAIKISPGHPMALKNGEMLYRNLGMAEQADKLDQAPRRKSNSIWLEIRDDIKRSKLK